MQQIESAFELTRKAGIRTMAYFILGIPVETYQDELNTIEFAEKIKPTYAQFSILSPYYGTKIFKEAVQKGWYGEVKALNPMDKDLKRPVILSENWDEKGLQNILKMAHRKFYFRLIYIVRQIYSVRSIHQIVDYFKIFLNIVNWMKR